MSSPRDTTSGPLTRYRVMAYVTGVVLALGTILLILSRTTSVDASADDVLWVVHGWLYILYVITALDLGVRRRWSIVRILLVALAGTIPFASFVAERKVVGWSRSETATR